MDRHKHRDYWDPIAISWKSALWCSNISTMDTHCVCFCVFMWCVCVCLCVMHTNFTTVELVDIWGCSTRTYTSVLINYQLRIYHNHIRWSKKITNKDIFQIKLMWKYEINYCNISNLYIKPLNERLNVYNWFYEAKAEWTWYRQGQQYVRFI